MKMRFFRSGFYSGKRFASKRTIQICSNNGSTHTHTHNVADCSMGYNTDTFSTYVFLVEQSLQISWNHRPLKIHLKISSNRMKIKSICDFQVFATIFSTSFNVFVCVYIKSYHVISCQCMNTRPERYLE